MWSWHPRAVRIRLAVLDMAGTTVSDAGTVEHANWEALSAVGVNPAPHLDVLEATMGWPKLEVFRRILGDDAIAHVANARFEDSYAGAMGRGEVEALPGAETTFAALRAAGVRICLTTGLSRATQEHIIDVLGWRDLVDLTLTAELDDGLRGRPYPDLVLAAGLRLRVDDVREVAVAGDTTNDLIAGARRARRSSRGYWAARTTRPRSLLRRTRTSLRRSTSFRR